MRDWQSRAHVRHYCKYHVVFVAKYRKKSIFGSLRRDRKDTTRTVSAAWSRIGRGIRYDGSHSICY